MSVSVERVMPISKRYQARSEQARRSRKSKNDENWQALRGEQNWNHKAEFQSRETTPGFPIAVEQIVGVFERALTDSDDWLLAQPAGLGRPFLPPDSIKGVLKFYLDRLWRPGNHAETAYGIQVFVGDAVKRGLLEPIIVAKVWPVLVKRHAYRLKQREPKEDGTYPAYEFAGKELERVEIETMRLAVDLIAWDDYLPDPSPALRYEIHRTRRQLHELLANPEYNQDVVKTLLGNAGEQMQRRAQERSRGERSVGPDPYEVEVFEGWGDIVDEKTGEVLFENQFWAWSGDQLLRDPTPNPFWDGTRPFIVAPLLRIPGSSEHKALADHAVPMWRATNELVNLMLDGAMRSAWGVGQVRPDIMESPEEIADGMPQGYTAVLKPNTPTGHKFYERVDNGEVPGFAVEGLRQLEGYLQESLATPDTKLGQLPQRAVKATEIVQALQGSGSLFESFAARFEDTLLEPLFEKAWKLILQYADSFLEDELVQVLGARDTLRLEGMPPTDRFRMLHRTAFKVRGLRGLAAQERGFQKLMTLVNLLSSSPQFADHFGQYYDFAKLWERVLRMSGNDPSLFKRDAEDVGPDQEQDQTQQQPAPPGSAGGQLNPQLNPATGASQPNITTTLAAQRGEQSQFAPNNPAAPGAA